MEASITSLIGKIYCIISIKITRRLHCSLSFLKFIMQWFKLENAVSKFCYQIEGERDNSCVFNKNPQEGVVHLNRLFKSRSLTSLNQLMCDE